MRHIFQLSSKTYLTKAALPVPYDFLLTQSLLTTSLRQHYERTPIIHIIDAHFNAEDNTYTRIIHTLIDKDKARDSPTLAQAKNETLVVELAWITINFNALPARIIHDILHTNTPFGQLIVDSNIAIYTKNRRYFSIDTFKNAAVLTNCCVDTASLERGAHVYSQQLGFRKGAHERGEGVSMQHMTEAERMCNTAVEDSSVKPIDSQQMLYGRKNTIVRSDNHQWLARVEELVFVVDVD